MDTAELRGLFLFDGLDDDQLAELGALADEVHFAEGEVLFRELDPAEAWWVLLSGRVELLRRSGHEESAVGAMERPGVWAGGFQAWAESAGYLATGRGAEAGRMMRLSSEALSQLVRSWSPLGVHLIEGFFQTVRNLEAMSRQRAGLVALGTLAAGLAHEINNPAAAAARAAEELRTSSAELVDSLVLLAERSLSPEQFVSLDALRREIAGMPAPGPDPLAVSDAEEALLDWMDGREVDRGWRIASTLAGAGVDVAWCDRLTEVLDDRTLGPGLEWVASTLTAVSLIEEIGEATHRVSTLVGAVRSYSQLDRASVQVIDVTDGIESTLVMLGQHLAGVDVERDYADDLPRIEAIPGELNQVWTNLIDNAIDAMGGHGTLRISARPAEDGHGVVVDIADTGHGMPPDVRPGGFEPFFTTKDGGGGRGLGLDISRRIIVERHRGEIAIESEPGRTVMSVRLPLSPA